MMMFWIFLIVDLFTIGIFYAVYGGKREYSEGMLMGVHMPRSAAESSEVSGIMRQYRKRTVRFYLWNGIISAVICLLNFWYMSVFIVAWILWLIEICAGAMALLFVTHRKLYDLKVERGWVGSGGSRIMAADTKTSAGAGKMGLSPWWHVLFAALILMPCLIPDIRTFIRTSAEGEILLMTSLAVCLVFAALHAVLRRTGNKVYSEDSGRNTEINRMQKNVWSWSLAGCGAFNALGYLYLAGCVENGNWIGSWAYMVYFMIESVPALFLIGGMVYIRSKRAKLLAADPAPLYIDDDVCWKNGWYSNPNDKRLIVQDWICPWNYTSNMARPAAKVFLALTVVFVAGILVVTGTMLARFELTPIGLEMTQDGVEITSGYSDLTVGYEDIRDVGLREKLPDDDYKKVNGGDTDQMLVGRFKGKETGNCRLYIYTEYSPILEITTADGPVYVNSRTDGEAEKWYEEIREMIGKKNQL